MDSKTIFEIVIAIIGILGGSGGVFAFINSYQQNKREDNVSSAGEWKRLYDEMKDRVDKQEQDNTELKNEIQELRSQIEVLMAELESYKKYDSYRHSLETYIEILLNALKPLVSSDAFSSLIKKRPSLPNDKQAKGKSSTRRR